MADRLLVGTGAVAILGHNGVLDHLALLADEILHLVLDEPSVHQVDESALDVVPVQLLLALWVAAEPRAKLLVFSAFRTELVLPVLSVKREVPADVKIETVAAVLTDHVWDHKDKAWLYALLSLR